MASGCFGGAANQAAPQRPNILLLSIDTLRADRLESYGYDRETSPALTRLAQRGVRFENVIAESPWTIPSHVTMLTGLHPATHRVVDPRVRLDESVPTLAEMLGRSGYRTVAFTEGGNMRGGQGLSRGFESYDDTREDFAGTVELVLPILSDADSDSPVFVFLHTYDVHCPYKPKAEYVEKFKTWRKKDELTRLVHCGEWFHRNQKRKGRPPATAGQLRYLSDMYDASIRTMDDVLGDFVAKLDQEGILENTVVIVTSDHGEAFLDAERFGHLGMLYVEVLRVPLLVVGPGIPAGRVAKGDFGLVDIAPTILELTGGAGGYEGPGRTLLADLDDVERDSARLHFSENDYRMIRRSVMTTDRQLVWDIVEDKTEYFDLSADPAGANPLPLDDRGRELDAVLREWVEDVIRSRSAGGADPEARSTAALSEADAEKLRALGYID